MSPPDMSNISRGEGGGAGGEGGSGMMSIRERIRAMQLEREHEHDHDENEAGVGSTPARRPSSASSATSVDGGTTKASSPEVVPSWKIKAREAAAARKLREAAERLQKRREGEDDDGGGVAVGVGVGVGTRRPNNIDTSGAPYSRRRPHGIGSDCSHVDRRSDEDGEEGGPREGARVVARPTTGQRSRARTAPPSSSSPESQSAVVPPRSQRSPPSLGDDAGSNKKSPSSFLLARQMFQARAAGESAVTASNSTGTGTGMTSSSTAPRPVQVAKTRKRRQFAAGRLGDCTGDNRKGVTGGVLEEDWSDDPTIDHGGNDSRSGRASNLTAAKGKHDLRAMDFAIDFHGEDDEEGGQPSSNVKEQDVATTATTTATMRPRPSDDGKSFLRDDHDPDMNDTARALHDDDDYSLGSTSSADDYYQAPTSPIGARGLSDLMIEDNRHRRGDTGEATPKTAAQAAVVVTPPPSAAPSSVSSSGCGRSDNLSPKPHPEWSGGRRSDHAGRRHPFGDGGGDPQQRQQQGQRRLLSPSAESVMSGEVDDARPAGFAVTGNEDNAGVGKSTSVRGGPPSRGGFTSEWEEGHVGGGAAAAIVIADGSSVVRRIPPRDTLDADWAVGDCVSAPSDEEDASTGTVKISNTQESVNSGSEQRQQGLDGQGRGRQRGGGDVDSEQGQSLPSSGIFSRGGPPPGTTPQRQPPPPEVTPPPGGQRQKGSTPFSNRYHGGGQYEKLFNVIHDVATSNLTMLERMASRSVLGAYVTPKWRCGENAGTAAATDVVDLMTPTTAAASAAANDILLAEHGTSITPPLGEFVEESVAIEVEYMEDRPTS